MSVTVSGSVRINCDKDACKKVIQQSDKIEWVTNAFMVDKKSENDPDVIVNVSGITEYKIQDMIRNFIKPIRGVNNVTYESGKSLLY